MSDAAATPTPVEHHSTPFSRVLFRWSIPMGAFFVLGPLAAWLTASLRGIDGSSHATALLSTTPALGLIKAIGALIVAAIGGGVAARLNDWKSGIFTSGLVLAWAAWATGSYDMLARQRDTGSGVGVLFPLVIEALVLGAIAVAVAAWLIRIGKDVTHTHLSHPKGESLLCAPSLRAAGLALLVALPVAAIIAASPAKGQTVAAAVVAGMLGATVGRATHERAPASAFILSLAAVALLAPLTVLLASGLPIAAHTARILPLDALAGAFLGVPLGIGWADSMVEKHSK